MTNQRINNTKIWSKRKLLYQTAADLFIGFFLKKPTCTIYLDLAFCFLFWSSAGRSIIAVALLVRTVSQLLMLLVGHVRVIPLRALHNDYYESYSF